MNNQNREDQKKKVEFIFDIPIRTDNKVEFTHQQVDVEKRSKKPSVELSQESVKDWYRDNPEYLFANIASKIAARVNEQLPKFGLDVKFGEFAFNEFVKNCFDAYVKNGLKIGDNLQIKLVIQEKDGKLIIKIKDNGPGFKDKEKGERFERTQINYDNKTSVEFLGRNRVGLGMFELGWKSAGIKMTFKNRKNEGATVELALPLPSKKRSHEKESLVKERDLEAPLYKKKFS